MSLLTQNTTHVVVEIYSWKNGKITVNDPTFGAGTRGPVTSISTNKRFGVPAGNWTVELTGYAVGGPFDRVPWSDLVEAGDWITIDVVKNGRTNMAMVGKVDDVQISVSAGSAGEARIRVTLTGRDAGAPLEDTPVYFNPADPVHNNLGGKDLAAMLTSVSGAPHEVLTGAIKGLFSAEGLFGGHVKVPPQLYSAVETPWVDVLGMDPAIAGGTVQTNLRGTVFAPTMLEADAGTVWAFLESWRNPAMNEMWIDSTSAVTPRRWYLFLRERPFVNTADGQLSPWYGLPPRIVDARTLVSAQLSRGSKRINHVLIQGAQSSILGTDAGALYPPVADFASVARYGLRKFEEQSRYFDDVGGDDGFTSEVKSWLDLILSWNCLNHVHLDGSLSLGELRADIRVGHKVIVRHGPIGGFTGLPADGGVDALALSFYVEGVSHRWAAGTKSPMCSTTLQVSRGFVEGQRLPATLAAAAAYSGTTLVPGRSANGGDFEPADSAGGIEAGLEGLV